MSMQFIRRAATVFVITALAGATLFLVFENRSMRHDYEKLRDNYDDLIIGASTRNIPRYGIIRSLEPDKGRIVLEIENRYVPLGKPYPFNVFTSERTAFVRQSLEGSMEAGYDAITTPQPASFSDLKIGDKVAAILRYSEHDEAEAIILLFGNPL